MASKSLFERLKIRAKLTTYPLAYWHVLPLRNEIKACTVSLVNTFVRYRETHPDAPPIQVWHHIFDRHIQSGVHWKDADRQLAAVRLLELKMRQRKVWAIGWVSSTM